MPSPYKAFAAQRIALRRGQVSLVVSGPGVGKSALALDISIKMAPHRVLYVCVDTDQRDMAGRITSSVADYPTPGDHELDEFIAFYADEVGEATGHIRWMWDGAPTIEDVSHEVECYGAVYGAYPELIVIDNLTSLDMGGEMSYHAIQDTISLLNACARKTAAHVMVLHHATGAYEDGDKPIPLSGLENKAGKRVAMVLTMTRLGSNLRVYPVKNRGGSGDARAHRFVTLQANLDVMKISDPPEGGGYV